MQYWIRAKKEFVEQGNLWILLPQRESLCLWLEKLILERGAKKLEIGMEPTGGYETHFYKSLKEWDFKCESRVKLVPTTLVKGNQKAKGERTKTDQTSAISIAEGMISYPESGSENSCWRGTCTQTDSKKN